MAKRSNQQQNAIPELEERVVSIKRVSKTVKGGRRMQLSALVVVGDGKGRVGVGMGKSQEVPNAIKKGVEDAKKNMFKVPITEEGTVPHEVMGVYGAGRVLIRPAVPGTGVMAGGPVRAVLELAGVKNVITKSLGTSNSLNIVKATAEGLKLMESPEDVARRRGVSVSHIFGTKVVEKASETEKVGETSEKAEV
ncbi:30S ribosomal protein S5 [Phoenicibacter congonensis]|uniref:30S ribosomal protein S5 n=1 Tax=Phoenicibacter congonensis TaxID=1944646 RepID=UPI0009A65290|nr:30S ribosomal protein S5 [Phoenicibacter congonensis]